MARAQSSPQGSSVRRGGAEQQAIHTSTPGRLRCGKWLHLPWTALHLLWAVAAPTVGSGFTPQEHLHTASPACTLSRTSGSPQLPTGAHRSWPCLAGTTCTVPPLLSAGCPWAAPSHLAQVGPAAHQSGSGLGDKQRAFVQGCVPLLAPHLSAALCQHTASCRLQHPLLWLSENDFSLTRRASQS